MVSNRIWLDNSYERLIFDLPDCSLSIYICDPHCASEMDRGFPYPGILRLLETVSKTSRKDVLYGFNITTLVSTSHHHR